MQGICPGNRLRILPGVYEVTEPQIISSCTQQKTQFNLESKHQSWHANLNKVIKKTVLSKLLTCYFIMCYCKQVTSQQKLGDLLTYDTPQKTVDSNGYNVPPTKSHSMSITS